MLDPRPRGTIVRSVVAVLVAGLVIAGWVATPASSEAALPRWTGTIDLYRPGVFTTQQSWLWCTAADVQIIRNIADGANDHSSTNQRRYFGFMRARNRYDIPVRDGVDPAGWAAGLRHYVDARYRLTANRSFDAALRSAVTNLRRTGLPVGITVAHGNHAWVLTGFSATADPARTQAFTVTSVRVVGPLWGLQSRTYGYDMRPDRRLTPKQLRGFFTPWHYAGVRMAWEGRWVSIQPVARSTSTGAAAPLASASPPLATPSHAPAATAAASTAAPPTIDPSSPGASAPTAEPSTAIVARAEPSMTPEVGEQREPTVTAVGGQAPVGALLLVVAALAAVGGVAWRSTRRG